jgi:sterol desaturase/sphingolipid hydroxylase (fatty acid hydroxylase superfamily)
MIDYAGASAPLLPIGFLFGVPAGLGFIAGALLYVFFAAWAHQMHHERPELVFWMKTPVHRVHHDRQLRRANFGLVTDFWDRVFGTYVPLPVDAPRRPRGWIELFRIDWGWTARARSPWRRAGISASRPARPARRA